jgi:peptidyl-prolyl cis-trans isomerase C
MTKQTLTIAVLAALTAIAGLSVQAQDKQDKPAAPAKAAAAPAASTGSKDLFPKAYYDFLLKERSAQGQPDTAEARAALREQLNTRELLAREAKKKGLDKSPDVKTQTDLSAQTVLVNAFVADWVKANPVSDAALHKEYDAIKAQMGDKEYKVRHILVEKEDEAKDIIAELQKGTKFESLATRSKDPGSKDKGGDLDWNAPGNFVKPFSDAMVKLPKGKFTAQPVQTQYGWHVIEVDDIRDAKIPPFDDVKAQLQQKVQRQKVEAYMKDLKAKNGL